MDDLIEWRNVVIAGSYSSVKGPRYFQEIGLTASGGDREVKREEGEYKDDSLGEGVERKKREERREKRRKGRKEEETNP